MAGPAGVGDRDRGEAEPGVEAERAGVVRVHAHVQRRRPGLGRGGPEGVDQRPAVPGALGAGQQVDVQVRRVRGELGHQQPLRPVQQRDQLLLRRARRRRARGTGRTPGAATRCAAAGRTPRCRRCRSRTRRPARRRPARRRVRAAGRRRGRRTGPASGRRSTTGPGRRRRRRRCARRRRRPPPGPLVVTRMTAPRARRSSLTPTRVSAGHSSSAPDVSSPWPSTRAHASSVPASSRHDQQRRVRWCSLCSWVKPIAPCTWCASRATTSTAAPARTLAAAAASTSGLAAVDRLDGGVDQRRHRGHLTGHLGQLHLDRLELAQRAAELLPARRRTAPSRPAPAPAPRTAAPPGPARTAPAARSACASVSSAPAQVTPSNTSEPRGSPARFAACVVSRPVTSTSASTGPTGLVASTTRCRATPAHATSVAVPVSVQLARAVAVVDAARRGPRRRWRTTAARRARAGPGRRRGRRARRPAAARPPAPPQPPRQSGHDGDRVGQLAARAAGLLGQPDAGRARPRPARPTARRPTAGRR